jgi:hypothetical protein
MASTPFNPDLFSSGQIRKYLVDVLRSVSATAVKLLHAASEMLGGNKALAVRLGINDSLLLLFMDGSHELPDVLLLRAVDIILAERQSWLPVTGQPAGQRPQAITGEN